MADAIAGQMHADSWASLLSGIGTALDKRTHHHFKRNILTYQQAMDLWSSDDMAARAVELVPAECFAKGYELNIMDEGSYSDLKEVVEQKLIDWHVDDRIERAMQFERAYGGSAIVIFTKDGAPLDEPIENDADVELESLSVYEPIEIQPHDVYSDPLSPNYGRVEFYRIGQQVPMLGGNASNTRIAGPNILRIHESRVIPFTGIRVSNFQHFSSTSSALWGDSVFVRMLEVLRDFDIGWSSVGLIATDVSQPVITVENLMQHAVKHQQALLDRMRALELGRSTARAILIDAKEKFERQTTNLTGVPDLLDRLSRRLAAAIGVPLSLLMFGSDGGLGQPGQNDLEIWRDSIRSMQRRRVGPIIRRFAEMAMHEERKYKLPKKWGIKFHDLKTLSDAESAEARRTQAQTDVLYIKGGVFTADEIRKARFGGGYSFDTPIRESAKAPGFLPPLPSGVIPSATNAAGVVTAVEASKVQPGTQASAASAHTVGGYTRRNPVKTSPVDSPAAGGAKEPQQDASDTSEADYQRAMLERARMQPGFTPAIEKFLNDLILISEIEEAEPPNDAN